MFDILVKIRIFLRYKIRDQMDSSSCPCWVIFVGTILKYVRKIPYLIPNSGPPTQIILKKQLKCDKHTNMLYILCKCLYQNGYEVVIYSKNRSQYHLIFMANNTVHHMYHKFQEILYPVLNLKVCYPILQDER